MLSKLLIPALVILSIPFAAFAQKVESIPATATILEERTVTSKRKLVLWMPNPTKHPSGLGPDDVYTCHDHTRGSYYSGSVRVTLVNVSTGRAIHTLEVRGFDWDGPNSEIDLPYLIRSGYYYAVRRGHAKIERKPRIMALKDYNGDGMPQEFALFDAPACMGLGTTLIGYSARRDRLIQYPILTFTPEGTTTYHWLDYLFSKRANTAGNWRYDIDYRGRGGTLDSFRVRYEPKKERFVATITRQR